jgi:hypothetical protein
MKVAVSIPDPVFAEAEALAKRLNTSRSDLYARALHAFVGTHAPDRVTDAMNATIDAVGAGEDADFVRAAARRALEASDW